MEMGAQAPGIRTCQKSVTPDEKKRVPNRGRGVPRIYD